MKDLLVIAPTFWPVVGGSETHLLDYALEAKRRGYRMVVATCGYRTAQNTGYEDPVEVVRERCLQPASLSNSSQAPASYARMIGPHLLRASIRAANVLRGRSYVVHAHSFVAGAIAAALFPRHRRVLSTHGSHFGDNDHPQYDPFRSACGFIAKRFHRLLAVSQHSRRELMSLGADPARITVYRYWVDQTVFEPRGARYSLPADERPSVLFAGRLVEDKGLLPLLEAAKRAGVRLVVAGTGPLQDRVQATEGVAFAGALGPGELASLYRTVDALCVPSSISGDGIPRVIAEALSCGTPVIASRRGGIPEAIDDSCGALIETPNVEQLEQALRSKAFLWRDTRDQVRDAAGSYARKVFSVRNADTIFSTVENA